MEYIWGFLIAAFVIFVVTFLVRKTIQAVRGDPEFWEGEIRRFERQDRRDGPPEGVILFTGSSSIRFWKTLAEDMAPLRVANRGFGGAQIHQVTFYADRIIFPYKPKGIVFYAGENDIAGMKFSKGKSPQELLEAFKEFCETVHGRLPDVSIYFISIKLPKLRLEHWPQMQIANKMIRLYCEKDERLAYIDVVPPMLDEEGRPRKDLFKWDGIHMNPKGYVIWTEVVKPILEEAFGGVS